MNYYNEIDKNCVQWLRNMIAAGILPDGDVDDRPIQEVQPNELKGYTQCHFFAGVGGWSLALRLAGWADDRPVWTGSCPCQPFSTAGKNEGVEDERHLWPEFYRLIKVCKPDTVFGEQVEGAVKHGWLDGVSADLEAEDYAVGSVVLGAHSVGAPHIRQRLWWVADSSSKRCKEQRFTQSIKSEFIDAWDAGDVGGVADSAECRRDERNTNLNGRDERIEEEGQYRRIAERGDDAGVEVSGGLGRRGRGNGVYGREDGVLQVERPCGLGYSGISDAESERDLRRPEDIEQEVEGQKGDYGDYFVGSDNFWSNSILIPFLDGKARRIKPGTMPLVDGFPGRVGQIRAYGNTIVPEVAAEFIKAYLFFLTEQKHEMV